MADWQFLLTDHSREKNAEFSRDLLEAIDPEFRTRKPRSALKRDLMKQLGLPDKFPEVQYPSPGNTPPDLDEQEI